MVRRCTFSAPNEAVEAAQDSGDAVRRLKERWRKREATVRTELSAAVEGAPREVARRIKGTERKGGGARIGKQFVKKATPRVSVFPLPS